MRRAGLDFDFFEAIDGRALSLDQVIEYDRAARLRKYGADLRAGEVGTYLSHLRVIEAAARGEARFTLILEDDAAFDPALGRVLDRIDRLDDDFEVIRLCGGGRTSALTVAEILPGIRLARCLDVFANATAYIVSRGGAAKIAAFARTMIRPIDMTIDRYWDHGSRSYAIMPFPVRVAPGLGSDVGARADVWDRPGMGHWRGRTKLLKIGEGVARRARNIAIRAENLAGYDRRLANRCLRDARPLSGGT